MQGNYLKSLRSVHLVLLAAQCMMLAIALHLVMQKKIATVTPLFDRILQVIALLVSFAGVFGAIAFFKKRLVLIRAAAESPACKAGLFRRANIIQWALLQATVLFSITCFLLTGNYAFLALAICLIIFFTMLAPSRLKTMLQLQINKQDLDKLQ